MGSDITADNQSAHFCGSHLDLDLDQKATASLFQRLSLRVADARQQVAMQLLHSEWEYVSTLNQLYDKYKAPPAHHVNLEP